MRQVLLLMTFFVIAVSPVFAQTVYKDYQDGRVYVKLKSYYNPKTGEAMIPNYRFDANNLPFVNIPDKKFGITRLERAFKIDAGEKLNSTLVLEFSNASLVDALIDALKYDPFVEYVEKIPLDRLFLTPNDPERPGQWHLNKINAVSAWNYASSGSNIIIAIVDDAVERNHQDLAPNVWVNPGEIAANGIDDDGNGFVDDINGWDVAGNSNAVDPPSDAYDHGTHVAGIASAATNNAIGISSIGFSCKIMCVKATTSASSITAGYAGILYAANNKANIINMSWGGNGSSTTNENVINYALSKGCILVAAAGNDNVSSIFYPAGYPGVISVASTTTNDTKSSFSNYGPWVKISAPGSNIFSTTLSSTYGNLSGTSMASPLVAGLLGLMQFLNPGMPDADLIQCMYSSADNISDINPSFSGQLGAGRINAAKAMECVSGSLNRAPIADFTSTNPAIVAGSNVVFTDQSSYSPTSWQWSFPGGSPSSFNGKTPPSIVYNATGQYTVTLTVSNAFGGNAKVMTNYVNVTPPPTCLTVNFPKPNNWSVRDFTFNPATFGNVNGTNGNNDRQKAMYFNLFNTNNTTLTSVAIFFAKAGSLVPDGKNIVIRVLDGSSGSPGAQLGSVSLPFSSIINSVREKPGEAIFVDFPQSITLPQFKQFFISVDFSSLTWDSFGLSDTLNIFSTDIGETDEAIGTPTWNQNSLGQWSRYGTPGPYQVATRMSLYIHPFVTPNPAKSVISPKTISICSGNTVNFTSAGSTFGDILQWQFPGASAPQVINNQPQVSPLYPAGGTFKAYLLTRGGCQEVRIDSAVVTVTQSPVVSVNTSKNPICRGEMATLTASGATSYSWSPSTGLNTSTGAVVLANPQQTASYSITGTTGSCSSIASYELEVRPTSANVNLLASQTGITQPTSVSFTATPTGGGSNPVYNFMVNDVSVQNSGSNLLVRTVSPGDKIKCEMTSNEACVAEKTVTSNEVTMINSPLPVNLFSFSGRRTNGGNQLNWVTASEANSAKFVVERSSDGQSYTSIGEVAAAGNSNSSRSYGYLDGRPQTGDNYYRLKMVDKDGSFKYSNVVRIGANSALMITSVQPNPTTAGTRALLVITDGERGAANITISNVAGQVLKSYRVNNNTGNVQVSLSTDNMASGNYLVTYRNSKGEVVETIRWTVIR